MNMSELSAFRLKSAHNVGSLPVLCNPGLHASSHHHPIYWICLCCLHSGWSLPTMWGVFQSSVTLGCMHHLIIILFTEYVCAVCIQVEVCPRCGESHRPLSSSGLPASLRGRHGVWTAPQHLRVHPAGPGPGLQLSCCAGRHLVVQ